MAGYDLKGRRETPVKEAQRLGTGIPKYPSTHSDYDVPVPGTYGEVL